MPSSKYHREQAKLLAGLALTTKDAAQAERYQRAAQDHLERAEAIEASIAVVPDYSR
jgi:hypothetical protein